LPSESKPSLEERTPIIKASPSSHLSIVDEKYQKSEQTTLVRTPPDLEHKNERCSKIIVIDDDPINLHVIESVLANEPYDITTALTGEKAIQLLELNDYD